MKKTKAFDPGWDPIKVAGPEAGAVHQRFLHFLFFFLSGTFMRCMRITCSPRYQSAVGLLE